MRMRNVARFFDREPALDGYTGAVAFYCTFSSFDNVSGDGSTNRRRVVSMDPSTVPPARHCVSLGGQRWLLGSPTDDAFGGDTIRHVYNAKRVTDLLAILTPGQAALAQAGLAAYGQAMYFKDSVDSRTDSELDSSWNIFFAPGEPVAKGSYLRNEQGRYYTVRNTYPVAEGYTIAQADMLDADAAQIVTFKTGTYDRVSDSFTGGTVATTVLQFELTKDYRFRLEAEAQAKPGDRTVIVAASAVTPTVGMRFAMLSREWQVIALRPEGDGWALHTRLA